MIFVVMAGLAAAVGSGIYLMTLGHIVVGAVTAVLGVLPFGAALGAVLEEY